MSVEGAPRRVGLLGGGVIGGGWAARFVLNGIDVAVYDPDPDAARTIGEVLDNARRAYGRLTLAPLPVEGRLEVVDTPQAAVAGAELVQESAPERLELKQELLAAVESALEPDAIVGSSTSGLLPSAIAARLERPERLCVGHPFNPVYLLPLVEVVPGERTAPETTARAAAMYRAVGMEPLTLRRELDGFVADRMLEAMWREALWLVHDDVATVEELDDAIRLGPGLRFAIMGSFLTYRIAGGEAGMRHFMAQFGPALQWPWTRLTDVPELTDALLDRLVEQSDAQAAGRSVRELERVRDDCLVAILQALRSAGFGAGSILERYERELFDRAPPPPPAGDDGPLRLHRDRIRPEWVDYNGHAHESRYLQLFGDATDALLRHVGVDAAYLGSGGSYFTVETHLAFLHEARAGQEVLVETQVLGHDAKRLLLFHRLLLAADESELATAEQLMLHVDTTARRAAPAGVEVLERVTALAERHATLPRPAAAGRGIALERRGPAG